MIKNLLGRVKKNIFVLVVGAGLGLGVGWFFTGLDLKLPNVVVSPTPREYYFSAAVLVAVHATFGITFLSFVKDRSMVQKVLGLFGIIIGSIIAPLPVAFFGFYKVMPLISDLSLVYSEHTINFISDIVAPVLLLLFISFTTVIFLLAGKLVTKILPHSSSNPRGKS